MTTIAWEDASTSTYTADRATVGPYEVTVCLDDEGVLRPSFYWDIARDGVTVDDGWSHTITAARREAVRCARDMEAGTRAESPDLPRYPRRSR